jgi:hypothetical protein
LRYIQFQVISAVPPGPEGRPQQAPSKGHEGVSLGPMVVMARAGGCESWFGDEGDISLTKGPGGDFDEPPTWMERRSSPVGALTRE